MPTINVTSTPLSVEQKLELIKELTAVTARVTNTPASFNTVIINELSPDALGVGGESVTEIKNKMSK